MDQEDNNFDENQDNQIDQDTHELDWQEPIVDGPVPRLLDFKNNIQTSRAALLGVVVTTAALVGLILTLTLPWITYEGEREVYNEETGEEKTVEEKESIGYGEFDKPENMERMRWWLPGSMEFYEDAVGMAVNGFLLLTILGAAIYVLSVYQHLAPCKKIFQLIPDFIAEGQKRLLALHALSSLVILLSAFTLRAVPRFLQLQMAYNRNSEEFGTNQSIFAGWASLGVMITTGIILIFGFFTIYSMLRAGWALPEIAGSKMDAHRIRSRKYTRMSFFLIVLGIVGLIASLILPTLLLTHSSTYSDEETEIIFDDGLVHGWGEWLPFGDEFADWEAASTLNSIGFECILIFGLIASMGTAFHNFGKPGYFRFIFWVPVCLVTLISLGLVIHNILWIRGAGDLVEGLTNSPYGYFFTNFESDFAYNYFPIIISACALVSLSIVLYFHRNEILYGEEVRVMGEIEGAPEGEEIPWAGFSPSYLTGFPKKQMAISLGGLFVISCAFGVFAPDLALGGSSHDSTAGGPWIPLHDSYEDDERYLEENSYEDIGYYIGEDTIFSINFTLRWRDEEDEPFATNEPDEFRLTVETPSHGMQQSEWVANEHGEEGVIVLNSQYSGDPGPTGSQGTFFVTVDCGECGDQWYADPYILCQTDDGNSYRVSYEYSYWMEM